MRADRLIQILLLLEGTGRKTAKELAGRLEVSERTIHRDMEALSAEGFPVLADRGTGGGWYLQEGYRSMLTGMSRSDIELLLMPELAGRGMHSKWGEAFERVSRKLLGALPQGWREQAALVRRRIYVDGAGWHARAPDAQEEMLLQLQEALWAGKKITIRYGGGDGELPERTVSPWGLVVKGTVWYMVAFPDPGAGSAGAVPGEDPGQTGAGGKDGGPGHTGAAGQGEGSASGGRPKEPASGEKVTAEQLRTFRVSRIRHVRMEEHEAHPLPDGFDLAAYWEDSLVRFRRQLPVYLAIVEGNGAGIERLGETRYVRILRTEEGEGGQITAHVQFNTLESGASIILGLQGEVAVKEPEELVREVAAKAARLAALHGLAVTDGV